MEANNANDIKQMPTSRIFSSLNSRLILSFLVVSIIPLLVVGMLTFFQLQNALRDEAFNKLIAVRNLKANQVNDYFTDVNQDIQLISQLAIIIRSATTFQTALEVNTLSEIRNLGFLDNPNLFDTNSFSYYGTTHRAYHDLYSEIIQTKGYADILLVSPEGDIIYSYAKKDDFATNLLRGPYRETSLAQLCRNLISKGTTGGAQTTDYTFYPPSGEMPVSFIGIPISDQDDMVGMLIYELSIQQLSDLMQDYTGLSQTGETYLVGSDGLMRSNSRFFEENTFLQHGVDTATVEKGLAGETGVEIADNYRDIPVLSAYQPITIGESQWVLLADIEVKEALQAVNGLRNWMLGIVVLTALIVILAGFYMAQRLAAPLINLTEIATKIANGQLELKAPISGTIEVKRLANNFNNMTDRLRDLISSLRQRIAEQEITEAALRESETTNRALLDAVPDAIFQLDQDGTFLSYIPAPGMKPLIPPDEFLGKKQHEVLPSELAKHLQNKLERVIQTGKLQLHEYPMSRGLETEYYEARLVRMGSNKVLGMVRDITKRKQAEEALRASEIRYRGLFEHSPISLWEEDFSQIKQEIDTLLANGVSDLNAYFKRHPEVVARYIDMIKVLNVNQAALKLYKAESKSSLKKLTNIIISKDAVETFHNALIEFASGKTSFWAESSHLTRTGETINVFGNTIILPGFEKTWSRVIVSSVDFSERMRAIEALRESEENLKITINSIGDAVISTNTDGYITRMNLVAESLTGWKRDDAIGKPLIEVFNIINELTRELAENPVEKVMKTGTIVGLANHTVLVAKDGTEYHIADSGAPIWDAKGNILGVVLVFRDVTEQLRTEQELVKMMKLESVGTLAGGIAHDFNNILTGLFGNIELAKVYLSPDHKSHKYLESAWRSLESATNLTNQLLTFSKGGEPIKETLSIGEVITETAHFSIRGSTAKLKTDIAPELWLVEADKGQLSQVISNLVINAEQSMPMGGTILVAANNVETVDGRYIQLVVQDTGVGIPPQYLDKIFDPYFTTKNKGSGLGLATTHSIIMRHDGRITVDSHKDMGTTFTIFLPAVENPEGEAVVKSREGEHENPISSASILVMDDEEAVREVLGAMLTKLGYEVAYSIDGREAITQYQASYEKGTPFNVVITDLTIPGGIGGQAAAQEILKINPGAKIIATSGYATNPIMANYRKHGFKGIIVKPYRIADLKEVVQQVLET